VSLTRISPHEPAEVILFVTGLSPGHVITVLTDLTDLLQAICKKGIALNLTYIRSIDIT
jgi:hypothetical protein